jgi:hypothetical protein
MTFGADPYVESERAQGIKFVLGQVYPHVSVDFGGCPCGIDVEPLMRLDKGAALPKVD